MTAGTLLHQVVCLYCDAGRSAVFKMFCVLCNEWDPDSAAHLGAGSSVRANQTNVTAV